MWILLTKVINLQYLIEISMAKRNIYPEQVDQRAEINQLLVMLIFCAQQRKLLELKNIFEIIFSAIFVWIRRETLSIIRQIH